MKRRIRRLCRRWLASLQYALKERAALLRRRLHPDLGQRGEAAALLFLLSRGFDVVGRNVRVGTGELDIVAYDSGTLVFVEVKTRSRGDAYAPQMAVHRRKEEQVARLAEAFCHRYGLETVPLRFDVVAVTLEAGKPEKIEHFKAAF